MSNGSFSKIPPFITVNATTASPTFVNPAITKSEAYKTKTIWVVLSMHKDKDLANVFRRSEYVPEKLSRDVYEWKGNKWHRLGKDPQKYPTAPNPPPGAYVGSVEGVEVWTMQPMTSEETNRLRLLTRRLRNTE